ncbi:hypothetical protein [Thalassospira lucentensis]|uniref:hypothetical protein n=1 Tax=Thalassospira lucentensis TaxID=168935 RepID=UPI003AA8E5C7
MRFTSVDDSNVAISYVDRSDTTIPILVSNTGTRPAVIDSRAFLEMSLKVNGAERTYFLWFAVSDGSRDQLILPEGQSKQYFYGLSKEEAMFDGKKVSFEMFMKDLKLARELDVESCYFHVGYKNFSGSNGSGHLLIHSKKSDLSVKSKISGDTSFNTRALLENLIGGGGCIIKIPQPLRDKYGY